MELSSRRHGGQECGLPTMSCSLGVPWKMGGGNADLRVGVGEPTVNPRRDLNGHRLKAKPSLSSPFRPTVLGNYTQMGKGQQAVDRRVFKSNPVPPASTLRNQGAYLGQRRNLDVSGGFSLV